jgi:hypothetical protein
MCPDLMEDQMKRCSPKSMAYGIPTLDARLQACARYMYAHTGKEGRVIAERPAEKLYAALTGGEWRMAAADRSRRAQTRARIAADAKGCKG